MIWLVVDGLGQHNRVSVDNSPGLQSSCNFRGLRPPGFRTRELERQVPGEGTPQQVLLVVYPIYPFSSSSLEVEPWFGRERKHA